MLHIQDFKAISVLKIFLVKSGHAICIQIIQNRLMQIKLYLYYIFLYLCQLADWFAKISPGFVTSQMMSGCI